MEKYSYTYKVTHRETNEYYYGSRTSKHIPINDINYLGSYTVWKPDKSKLTKEILGIWEDEKEALIEEAKLVRKHIKNPLNRNYHIPNIKFNLYKRTSRKWLIETYGEEKGEERYNEICNKRVATRRKNNSYKVNQKTKDKISNTLKGNIPWNVNNKLSKNHVDNIKKTWHSKKRMAVMGSTEYKEKMSESLSGSNNPMYGKKMAWISNDSLKKTKLIEQTNLKEYLNNDWVKGRKKY